MAKLVLRPDADGYQMTDGTEVIATALDGGAARYRRDKIGASKQVNVKWTMNPGQYAYWRAFYRTATKKGSLPFTCDLVSEDGMGPAEHVCNFVPGSVTLPEQQGYKYVQSATLEVRPLTYSESEDEALILLYSMYGEGASSFLNSLEHLVNVTMPETLN